MTLEEAAKLASQPDEWVAKLLGELARPILVWRNACGLLAGPCSPSQHKGAVKRMHNAEGQISSIVTAAYQELHEEE
jgi:hypothetical protein